VRPVGWPTRASADSLQSRDCHGGCGAVLFYIMMIIPLKRGAFQYQGTAELWSPSVLSIVGLGPEWQNRYEFGCFFYFRPGEQAQVKNICSILKRGFDLHQIMVSGTLTATPINVHRALLGLPQVDPQSLSLSFCLFFSRARGSLLLRVELLLLLVRSFIYLVQHGSL